MNKFLKPYESHDFCCRTGTRLKPLTDHMPKALVPVAGRPMLEYVNLKLKSCRMYRTGNQHPSLWGEQIIDFLQSKQNFGISIHISDERDKLLDTGGGIKKAAAFFKGNEPFLVHNVDILSNTDLTELYQYHLQSRNDATLLVSPRQDKVVSLLDADNRLRGWVNKETGQTKPEVFIYQPDKLNEYAFSGIHVISPSLLPLMDEQWNETFSIMDFYLQNCERAVLGGHADFNLKLMDIESLKTLAKRNTFWLPANGKMENRSIFYTFAC